ncbi:MAG: MgtC/SapB family protein [Rhodocyclaceae bacterium]|jgi:uncharacterized membrane protein (DUF4010 family)|nr:MgtC/SapB family protein [Rhodocyclaceae bacterium]MCA3021060.1 MgtC/SapB family protein [Rhodocyclaceae bacterium]MCA3028115.1 MgtC/SapB family protein [Rhodocyclaceae bacterium]MCA3042175.1 MgtC/SapB family protein [Rhodocyclaceae bacterium]MCA3054239.1 MgtC/SapB family protein [Rhodocyclaceae bacterium]
MTAVLDAQSLLSVCVALGIGLLIGAERERRKGSGPNRSPAGIRTFAVVAFAGAVAMLLGDVLLMAVVTLLIGASTLVAYRRAPTDDPGITTEIALILTCLIGGLAARQPLFAAAMGVALAGLLAARDRIHHFVRGVLSEHELHDALLFAAVVLIALPLAPDRFVGPFGAINPRTLTGIVVLVMLISAMGYVALRLLGPRFGLPVAGLAAGFISSSATIHAMGRRTREEPALMSGLVAGAVLSSAATILQLAAVLAFLAPSLLILMIKPLLFAGTTAVTYAGWFTWQALQTPSGAHTGSGRAFDLLTALGFAGLTGAVSVISAALNAWTGDAGVMFAIFVSGLADAHAAAVASASLQLGGKITAPVAMVAILTGLSANTLVKAILAVTAGGWPYARRIIPGLGLMIAAAWVGIWV